MIIYLLFFIAAMVLCIVAIWPTITIIDEKEESEEGTSTGQENNL